MERQAGGAVASDGAARPPETASAEAMIGRSRNVGGIIFGTAPLVALLAWAWLAASRSGDHPWSSVVAFGAAALLAAALLPPFIGVLRRFSVLDNPNHRSSHTVPTVRGGGYVLVIVVSSLLAAGVAGTRPAFLPVCVALAVLGFADDLQPMPSLVRLSVQLLAGTVLAPVLLSDISQRGPLLWLLIGVVVVWLVGFVNAFNFMDGINGISAAQVLTTAGFWWLLARDAGLTELQVAAAVLGGAALGFLPFNFPRARVFLGDAGSYFLGAALAAFAVSAIAAGIDPIAVGAPLLLYIADVGTTLIRRFRKGEPLLEAHRTHCYQLLCRQGWSHTVTTSVFAGFNVAVAAIAFLTRSANVLGRIAALLVMVGGAAIYLSLPTILRLRGHVLPEEIPTPSLAPAESVFVRPGNKVLPRWLPANAPLLAAIDFSAWFGGGLIALMVLRGAGAESSFGDVLRVLPLTFAVQMIMGIASGMYRWRWRVGSFGEMGGVATVLGLDIAFLTAVMLGADGMGLPRSFALIAALGAAPLMAAPRALWRVIRDRPGGDDRDGVQRVLVYGAGRGAALALPALRDPMSTLMPVGIIDDDPSKRFRSLNGVRVVGNGNDLPAMARQLRAEAVVIAIPSASDALAEHLVDEIERAGLIAYVVPKPGALGSPTPHSTLS